MGLGDINSKSRSLWEWPHMMYIISSFPQTIQWQRENHQDQPLSTLYYCSPPWACSCTTTARTGAIVTPHVPSSTHPCAIEGKTMCQPEQSYQQNIIIGLVMTIDQWNARRCKYRSVLLFLRELTTAWSKRSSHYETKSVEFIYLTMSGSWRQKDQ